LQNPEEKPDYITRFLERNWSKWEENVVPIIQTVEEVALSMARRKTVKMNDYDPDEEQKDLAGEVAHRLSQVQIGSAAIFGRLSVKDPKER